MTTGRVGHGSSRNRSMPGACGFLVLSQALEGPDRQGCCRRFDPEVIAIAKRRQFPGSEKRRLLAEVDRCKEAGTLGAWLNTPGAWATIRKSQLGSLSIDHGL